MGSWNLHAVRFQIDSAESRKQAFLKTYQHILQYFKDTLVNCNGYKFSIQVSERISWLHFIIPELQTLL